MVNLSFRACLQQQVYSYRNLTISTGPYHTRVQHNQENTKNDVLAGPSSGTKQPNLSNYVCSHALGFVSFDGSLHIFPALTKVPAFGPSGNLSAPKTTFQISRFPRRTYVLSSSFFLHTPHIEYQAQLTSMTSSVTYFPIHPDPIYATMSSA